MSFSLLARTRVRFGWSTLGGQLARNTNGIRCVSQLATRFAGKQNLLGATAIPMQRSGYATAAKATKPRTAAAKKTTAGRTKVAKKPARKTAAAKKPARKTAAKKPARKTAKKTKSKAKKAPVKRRGLTERQKELRDKKKARENLAELKKKALSPPERFPDSPMRVYVRENRGRFAGLAETVQAFKAAAPAEKQRLEQTAASNKIANENNYKRWVDSLEPVQVRDANNARRRLNALAKKTRFRPIHDNRLVTRPRTAFIYFVKDAAANGSFQNGPVVDALRRCAVDWKNLNASQKEKYASMAEADKARYLTEHKRVYGEEPKPSRHSAKAATA
ncbi:hypothetical protein KEM55_000692 [Ascosphaera atra]|nr:hypothetical protein KEM55_000692 [Ascosphaera atra]